MKKQSLFPVLSLMLMLGIFLQSCQDKCTETYTYTLYHPVYKSVAEVRADVHFDAAQALVNPGKIYVRDNLLIINEVDKGLHFYNISDASNPVNMGFLHLPGNMDMAVYGNFLYADSYYDLVVFDLANSANIEELTRLQDVFPDRHYENGFQYDPDSGVVVDWIPELISIEQNCKVASPFVDFGGGVIVFSGNVQTVADNGSGRNAPTAGIGGSMARFTIASAMLYAVTNSNLHPFTLGNPAQPDSLPIVNIGWDIETIFPYGNNLFIGSRNGMYIYDITNPGSPIESGQFSHYYSCDPVVVSGNTAYVTLRSGTVCEGFSNQLDVLDVSNLSNPALIKTYLLNNPHGLAIDGSTLFICDGDEGLKVFDAGDLQKIDKHQLDRIKNLDTYDVIPQPDKNRLILVAKEGIYFFDYSDPANLIEQSHIAVN